MNMSNYNRKTMQRRMMSKHEMSTASFTTKSSQELLMTKQENRMRIISTSLKQE